MRCPRARADQPRRNCRSGVLHPPLALRIALQLCDRTMGIEPHGTGGQHDPAEPFGPARRVALHAKVKRRLAAVGASDRKRGLGAISRAPARRQPRGGVVLERVRGGKDQRAIARDRSQNSVDEPRERRAGRLGPRGSDGQIDGRMIGGVKEKKLGGPDDKCPFQRSASPRQALFEPVCERLADRSEPTKRNGCDRAREHPVTRVETRIAQRQIGGEALFERPSRCHRLCDRSRCGHPRRQPRRRGLGGACAGSRVSALLSDQTRLASNRFPLR